MDDTPLIPPTDASTPPETGAGASLYEALDHLFENRRAQGKRSSLALILGLGVLATLAGPQTVSGATPWVGQRRETLVHRFGLRRQDRPWQILVRCMSIGKP